MAINKNIYVWLVFLVNKDSIGRMEWELERAGYEDITYYVPMVKVLTKQHKGVLTHKRIPMLFQYGFIRMPLKKAVDRDFLSTLKNKIGGINGYLEDRCRKIRKRPRKNKKGLKVYDVRDIPFATVEAYEITYYKSIEPTLSSHCEDDINKLKKGDFINLKGYPFDNLDAQVVSVNLAKEKVRVTILTGEQTKDIEVSFDNIFFTIYENYDEDKKKEVNYEDIKYQFKKQRILKADD